MAKNNKRPILQSPKGVAIFPYLNKADTKFDADGVYKVDLRVGGDEAEGLISTINETLAEAEAEAKKKAAAAKKKGKKVTPKLAGLPFFEACDEDGNETGEVVFRFKSKASGVSKKTGERWKRTIPLFDAKGKPSKAFVYGGSVLIVAFTAEPWVNPKMEYGVKLQLEAVQIIDLVTGGGQRSASRFGFSQQEGYSSKNEADDEDDETEDENDETEDKNEESNEDTNDESDGEDPEDEDF